MTAVEWLEQEIFRKYKFTLQKLNCQPLEEAIQQAKEMEKQQILNFAIWFNNRNNEYKSYEAIIEEYYNEKFKNK